MTLPAEGELAHDSAWRLYFRLPFTARSADLDAAARILAVVAPLVTRERDAGPPLSTYTV